MKFDYFCAMEKVSDYIGQRGGVSKRAYSDLLSFKGAVQSRFGAEVKSLILFGSRARMEARKDSDFDVAVIMHSANVGSEADRLLSKLAYPYLLKGTFITALSMPENLKRQAQSNLLAHSILNEGMEIA